MINKKVIDDILANAIDLLNNAYLCNKETGGKENAINTALVFPQYRGNKKTRVSEQELRFAFVEALISYNNKNQEVNNNQEKQLNLYYSIETPTNDKYKFSTKDNGNSDFPKAGEEKGESGKFDLVIFEKENEAFKRVCLIEFKANDITQHKIKKDMVKLHNPKEGDENVLRYFIEVFSAPNKNTESNVKERINLKRKDEERKKNFYYKENNDEYKDLMPVTVICIYLEEVIFVEKIRFRSDGDNVETITQNQSPK